MTGRTVAVNDRMQKGYRYRLTAPMGRNFDPAFTPDLTPKQMLRLGVFAGKYLTDCRREFPADWFARAKLAAGARDPALNCFGVDASQTLPVWRAKGWIHPCDPRGWFQWYCRYYMGRRMPAEDRRQIARWRCCTGPMTAGKSERDWIDGPPASARLRPPSAPGRSPRSRKSPARRGGSWRR